MTSKELDERIADIPNECFEAYPAGYYSYEEHMKMTKQLIRDCIAAVTPVLGEADIELFTTPDHYTGFDIAIDVIQANTKELLG
jgi:hypothetical protein